VSTPITSPSVAWYVQTAGASVDQGYRWLAVDPDGDPTVAGRVMQGDIAGRPLVNLLADSAPSVVLSRLDDGQWILLVSGLRPSAAPAEGDYLHRPIRVTIVGVAPSEADPTALLVAAAGALNGSLANALPLTWTEEGPAIVTSDSSWSPAPPAGAPPADAPPAEFAVDIRESVAVPDADADRRRVAAEIVAAGPGHLDSLPRGRPLLLVTSMVDRKDLVALRPWRAVTSSVTQRTLLPKEERSPGCRSLCRFVAVGVGVGLALVAWFVLSRVGLG
jgi:hypothetical protein